MPAEMFGGASKEHAPAGDKKPPAGAPPAAHTPPQRKSQAQQGNPSPEELAAAAAKAKETFHSGSEQKPAGAADQGQEAGLEVVTGFLSGHCDPNAGGYVAWTIDGIQREDGKDAKFASKDEAVLKTLAEMMEANLKVAVKFKPSTNPRFAHNIISVEQAKA